MEDDRDEDDEADQCPEPLGRHLSKVDTVESFDWDECVDRLVERGGYDADERADAVHHARVVVDVVDDAVGGNELEQVRNQLPGGEDWDELFELAEQAQKPVDEEQRPQ